MLIPIDIPFPIAMPMFIPIPMPFLLRDRLFPFGLELEEPLGLGLVELATVEVKS
jgi:hypothetical protein